MKKLLVAFAILMSLLSPALALQSASAETVDVSPDGCTAAICKDKSGSKNPIFGPDGIMTKATHILAIFVGVVATIAIIISGLMMMTAGGDATKTANARRALSYALVAVVVAIMAQLIVAFVLDNIAP